MTIIERIPILCDCCGREVMGYRIGDDVFWYDDRHGTRHSVKIPLDKSEKSAKNQGCTTE